MEELRLEPLNVFIGTNASGKSNLIEVLSLLAAAPVTTSPWDHLRRRDGWDPPGVWYGRRSEVAGRSDLAQNANLSDVTTKQPVHSLTSWAAKIAPTNAVSASRPGLCNRSKSRPL